MKTSPCVAFLLIACLRPSEERADRDLEVGHESREGATIAVDDGLCAVRELTRDTVVLWASAPAWSFTLEHPDGAGRTLDFEIQNAMPEGVLAGDGASVEELPGEVVTRRRYRVTLGGSIQRLTFAPPVASQHGSFRFALLSDVQEAIDRVGDIYDRINAEPDLSFLFGAGDLTEQGTHEELQRFQEELLALNVPYYTTLGNHELGQNPSLYHDYFGRGSFTFEYRRVRFTLLDSASATLDPKVWGFLDDWLERGKDQVHVVSMHIAPIDPTGVRNGSFASRAEASKLVGTLAAAGVDLTVYGHVHSYYGFENAGIPAFISGGGGAVPERFDGVGRHFMVFELDSQGGLIDHKVVQVDD